MKRLLLLLPIVLTGCITYVAPSPSPDITSVPPTATLQPVATPTTRVVYVTPAPTRAPTPPPVPTAQAGTDFYDYLGWASTNTQNISDVLNGPTDTVSDIKRMGRNGLVFAQEQVSWLNSHTPQECWKPLWRQHLRLANAEVSAFTAMADFASDAISELDSVITEMDDFNTLLQSESWCS